MPKSGAELFWELVEPMYADPAVAPSTMMGLPCVRLDGRFFASLDRHSGALLVKLSAERVAQLIAAGDGEPFAPAGRVFREWVAVHRPDRRRWRGLLSEARDHAAGPPSTTTGGFGGFGAGGLAFLAALEQDNTKRCFDAHQAVYRRELLEPAKAFITDLGTRLRQRVSAGLRAEPRVGGSLFRIANDRRFAPAKAPYKPHLDIAFWEGPNGPRLDPALILRVAPTEVHLGCGVMPRTGPALDTYRTALHDDTRAADLDREVSALVTDGGELSEPTRRRRPVGFEADSPAARFAVRDGFHVVRRFPHPPEITTAAFVGWCADRLAPFTPVHRWLADTR